MADFLNSMYPRAFELVFIVSPDRADSVLMNTAQPHSLNCVVRYPSFVLNTHLPGGFFQSEVGQIKGLGRELCAHLELLVVVTRLLGRREERWGTQRTYKGTKKKQKNELNLKQKT